LPDTGPDHAPTEFKEFTVQMAPASESDPGAVLLGWWKVKGRALTVKFEDGHEASRILQSDEDPARVARQMLRKDREGERGDFRRPLNFPSMGVA
jgi:hypothetical protein